MTEARHKWIGEPLPDWPFPFPPAITGYRNPETDKWMVWSEKQWKYIESTDDK